MHLQILVFLLLVLFTTGHSLGCYQCMSLTGFCADQKLTSCPSGASKCHSATGVTQIGDISTKVKVKNCAVDCASGSMNLDFMKVSSACCNSDGCNIQDAQDPRTATPNGNKCYSCDRNSCLNVLSCSGSEDRCVTATGMFGGQPLVIKGCVSKSLCDTASVSSVQGISCCIGNLCNGAKSVTQSFLFLCFPLLSFILMH